MFRSPIFRSLPGTMIYCHEVLSTLNGAEACWGDIPFGIFFFFPDLFFFALSML